MALYVELIQYNKIIYFIKLILQKNIDKNFRYRKMVNK